MGTTRDVWPLVHTERAALLDELAELDDEQWEQPSRLVEEVVHGEDVRRPLGLRHAYADEAVSRALRLQARTPVSFGGGKERVAGLRLVAADHGTTLGDGPEVRGPALSLLLVVSGRRVALDDLEGPGVAALAARG